MNLLRIALVPALALAALASQADTLIGNLDGNDGALSAGLIGSRYKAMGLTMPAGSAYSLTSATLRLGMGGAGVAPPYRSTRIRRRTSRASR